MIERHTTWGHDVKGKIGFVSLGCPKNLVDSEVMLGILNEAGYTITNDKSDADIIIVNTCGFIDKAKTESIEAILEMALCKNGKCNKLIVTGCLAERYKDELLKEIPEIDAIIGTGNCESILKAVEAADTWEHEDDAFDKSFYLGSNNDLSYLNNRRILTDHKGFAYLKISEGCSNKCAYCVIPSIRGSFRSRPLEDIIDEAVALINNGIKEIILVAQDTTNYGIDLYGEIRIYNLLNELNRLEGLEWIRILYSYPDKIDSKLIDAFKRFEKVIPYLDMPVQHASDRILKLMGRKGSCKEITDTIKLLRNDIPNIVIRTSVITGFPGEGENDFDLLCEFIKEIKFDRLGIFTYSKEEGTRAAKMPGQIPKKIKQLRYDRLIEIQTEIIREINTLRLGKTYKTLVEGVSEDGIFYYGRSYAEAPEIDGLLYFTSQIQLEIGSFVNVKILCIDTDLTGEVVDEFTE